MKSLAVEDEEEDAGAKRSSSFDSPLVFGPPRPPHPSASLAGMAGGLAGMFGRITGMAGIFRANPDMAGAHRRMSGIPRTMFISMGAPEEGITYTSVASMRNGMKDLVEVPERPPVNNMLPGTSMRLLSSAIRTIISRSRTVKRSLITISTITVLPRLERLVNAIVVLV